MNRIPLSERIAKYACLVMMGVLAVEVVYARELHALLTGVGQ